MRLFVSAVALASVLAQPVLAQSAPSTTTAATSAEIEKGISEAARSLESLSRILAVMGPGLSRAMQAAGPGIGRAVEKAQPSLNRALRKAEPQMAALAARAGNVSPRATTGGAPTGADMAASMQAAAASLEALSVMMGSVAPDLGMAYDAAAPELRGALAQARPALEEAIKAAQPELRRLAPATVKPVAENAI